MALSAFDEKSRPPRDQELEEMLGRTAALWRELKDRIAARFDPLTEEWGFSSAKTGWGLRLRHHDRAVLCMIPCAGYFLASMALGEKAAKAAHESDLPARVLEAVDGAVRYAEGRGVRLEVRRQADVRAAEKLAAIKMAR